MRDSGSDRHRWIDLAYSDCRHPIPTKAWQMTYRLRRLRAARLCPGACGLSLRREFSLASSTSTSKRALDTSRTPRMTSLKCWNSGVESNGAAFIRSPSVSGFVSRVPGASGKEASSSSLLSLAGQFSIPHAPSDNLFHDGGKTAPHP